MLLKSYFHLNANHSICQCINICFQQPSVSIYSETEEGIAQAIVRGEIDFERDPWTRVSEDAKDLVKGMLDPNPYSRMTVEEVLGTYVFHINTETP